MKLTLKIWCWHVQAPLPTSMFCDSGRWYPVRRLPFLQRKIYILSLTTTYTKLSKQKKSENAKNWQKNLLWRDWISRPPSHREDVLTTRPPQLSIFKRWFTIILVTLKNFPLLVLEVHYWSFNPLLSHKKRDCLDTISSCYKPFILFLNCVLLSFCLSFLSHLILTLGRL